MNGLDSSAALLGYILFAWQFPHFNALAWNLRAYVLALWPQGTAHAQANRRLLLIVGGE